MIYCIGDSFTFGAELPGSGYTNKIWEPSNLAWPALLSKRLNHPVTNLGKPGCGNTRIIKRAIDCTLRSNKDPIIIAWTLPLRTEFIDNTEIFDIWPGRNTSKLKPARISMITDMNKLYTEDTEYWGYKKFLRDVILLQSFFKQHSQPYLMIQSHQIQWIGQRYINKDNVEILKEQVDPINFLGWPFTGMTEWADQSPRGPGGHFLEEGHEKIADKVYEHIKNNDWVLPTEKIYK